LIQRRDRLRNPPVGTVLLTGASGYVGGQLAPVLAARDDELRCLMRRPDDAALPSGARAVRGDALSGDGLADALDGVDLAYYLIHSMGRGGSTAGFAERDRRAAETFGAAAEAAGVRRIVYLGGLGSPSAEAPSEHLRSREEVATVLARHVPELVHVRAAMIIGTGSASFVMLQALVRRLPVMICPRWIDTRTQPIAITDVVGALAALADRNEIVGDVELGGPEALSYREMLIRCARAIGRRPPLIVRVPLLTPRLSSHWVGLVTPVETGLVRPLIDGLRAEMLVHNPPPPGINDAPLDFEHAVRAALAG
jgi:uncharacterized protein YbjT (DUF2867 family)